MKRYQLISSDSVKIPRIHSIGFSDDPKVARTDPTVRNQYIIHYVLRGSGEFNGNAVNQGEGFLITPGTYAAYQGNKKDPWAFLWVVSEDPDMEYFFMRHKAEPKTSIFKFHNSYKLEDVVSMLTESFDRFYPSTQLAELFLRIFHIVVTAEDKPKESFAKLYFDFSANYVKSNLHSPLFVEDLCEIIGVSQPYLYKIFMQNLGCSPKKYITGCKITEAKRLLTDTSLSVTQIGASVGFQNVLDFSKFFSKEAGVSPTEYRSAHQ